MLDTLQRFIIDHYIAIVLGTFAITVLLELLIPAAPLQQSVTSRWFRNFSLGIIDGLLLRYAGLAVGVFTSVVVGEYQYGLLNALDVPLAWAFVVSFLALDVWQWLVHWVMHRIPWLWRVHQVHHSDSELDLSTGLRFHPIESLVTLVAAMSLIGFVGIAVEALVFRAVLFYFVNFYTHANIVLSARLDQVLRLVLVTPAMHRIHHSTDGGDSDRNFGAVLSVWDRLFGTYKKESVFGPRNVPVGLEGFPAAERIGLYGLLTLPFRSAPPALRS